MTGDVGLAFDEKVRRALAPLCGPLRIDAFLAVMGKERGRLSAAKAAASRPAGPGAPTEKAEAVTAPRAARPKEEEPAEPAAENLADSSKLRAEVNEFLHRDDRNDASRGEVDDYMDFIGHSAFNPEDIPG